jgi:Ala-tRNA(Pro) deacylase
MALCERLKQFLAQEKAPYDLLPHTQVFTAQEVAAQSHVTGWHLAKVVVVRDEAGGAYMVAIPAPSLLDIAAVQRATGKAKLRIAHEEDFRTLFPDCETGAMPPFGNLYGVPVYVDASLTRSREFVFQAGSHKEAVRMSYADYERLAKPAVGEFAAREAVKRA